MSTLDRIGVLLIHHDPFTRAGLAATSRKVRTWPRGGDRNEAGGSLKGEEPQFDLIDLLQATPANGKPGRSASISGSGP